MTKNIKDRIFKVAEKLSRQELADVGERIEELEKDLYVLRGVFGKTRSKFTINALGILFISLQKEKANLLSKVYPKQINKA